MQNGGRVGRPALPILHSAFIILHFPRGSMIAVVQRVTEAAVRVGGEVVGQIGPGLLVLAAVHRDDGPADVAWMAGKLAGLRVFRSPTDAGKAFDVDVRQAGGAVPLVNNFKGAGDTRKGRPPA